MGKILGFIIIIIIILIILSVLMGKFGFGFGKGEGGADGGDNGTSVTSVEDENSEEGEPLDGSLENGDGEAIVYENIMVSQATYIHKSEVVELEEFIEAVRTLDDNVVIKITDAMATQNAMEDLTKALDEMDRKYVIEVNEY